MVIITSERTRITSSTRPFMNPAVKPSVIPTDIPMREARSPTISEFGAPMMSRDSMSRPDPSVPSG